MKLIKFVLFTLILTITVFCEPLQVVSVYPMPNDEYVKLNSNIEVAFNKEIFAPDINEFTLTLNDGFTDIKGDVKYFRLLKKAVFIPYEKLMIGKQYKVTLWSGIRDIEGGRLLSSVIWIFSTGQSFDKTRPFLVSLLPANGEIGIPLEPEIRIAFSERISADSYKYIKLLKGNKEIPVKIIEGENLNKIILSTKEKLEPETEYTVEVNPEVSDLTGNKTGFKHQSNFFTQDIYPPEIIKIMPIEDERKVNITVNPEITFNDDMFAESINRNTVKLSRDNEEIPIILKYNFTSRKLVIIPEENLIDSSFYEIKLLSGIFDKGNNELKPFSYEFKTEDLTAPYVVEFLPEDNSENMPLDTVIKLKFSEIPDKNTVENGIVITDGDNIIPFKTEFNNYGLNIELIPEKLEKRKTYRITLKQNILDLERNPLDKIYNYGFKTVIYDTDEIQNKLSEYSDYDEKKAITKIQNIIGMPHYENYITKEQDAIKDIKDRIPPRIIDFFPIENMNEVPLNTTITAILSEDIQSHTLDRGIILTDGNSDFEFNTKYDRKFKKATIIPKENLKPSTKYSIIFNTEILDIAGNGLLSKEWKFNTAKSSDDIKIISELPEIKKQINPELLKEEVVEMKSETLDELKDEEDEEDEDLSYENRDLWAKKIVLHLRRKFAKQYAIVTANPKVEPTRFELALIVRSIVKKISDNELNRLFRTTQGIKDLIMLFQASVEYERELTILGVNLKSFEEKLMSVKIPVTQIRDEIYRGEIKTVK